jgi:hypothetical protein
LPAKGTARGALVGVKKESLLVSNVIIHDYVVCCMLQDQRSSFSWKLIVVYGSPYDDKKIEFIDELHAILSSWHGPMVIGGGGDFNLCRFVGDKRNGRINQKMADDFNDWINKWGLVELNHVNKKFTWSNNQVNPTLAKLDMIFVSTDWECAFPLVRVSALAKCISS